MKLIKSSLFFIICFLISTQSIEAQDKGVLTGAFQANANIFIRDSLIGAANIPQYDNELFGSEGWLNLNYRIKGFDMGVRFDYFNNSNLLNPNDSYTAEGIGRWYIKKKINKLEIAAGYLYDQIGSGIIYRAYEQRALLIDNALYGASLKYDLNESWRLMAFTGRQKFLFDTNPGETKGASLEGSLILGPEEGNKISLSPGIGFVNRTLDENTVDKIVDIVRGYIPEEVVSPQFNVYLMTAYNTMIYKGFTWYVEGAYKTPEVFRDPLAQRTELNGSPSFGRYVKESGSVLYSSLGFAAKGLGVTIESKRTENFNFRTDPTFNQLRGLVNYIPPMNRQNTYRLNARYSPAVQDLSEWATSIDIKYKLNKKLSILANASYIDDLNGIELFRELYTELTYKRSRNLQVKGGLQLVRYNQERYEGKTGVPLVETIVPFTDILYRFTRKKSIRFEAQYMNTEQDYGSWIFALAEYGISPHWIFELSTMYNLDPGPAAPTDVDTGEKVKINYPTFGFTYTNKSNRYSLRYVKQVEGIVCSGGICRLEPAFSGVKMTVNSNF